jgi:hypothetical protein
MAESGIGASMRDDAHIMAQSGSSPGNRVIPFERQVKH